MPIPTILKIIEAELKLGHIVDVEKHCKVLQLAFPQLSHKDIQSAILDVVGKYGGAAAWGERRTDGKSNNPD